MDVFIKQKCSLIPLEIFKVNTYFLSSCNWKIWQCDTEENK